MSSLRNTDEPDSSALVDSTTFPCILISAKHTVRFGLSVFYGKRAFAYLKFRPIITSHSYNCSWTLAFSFFIYFSTSFNNPS